MDKEKIKSAITTILQEIGEDTEREGLVRTPKRIADMFEEIFSGYSSNIDSQISVFHAEKYDEIVLVKDIAFQSMCEHHMLPFVGKAHIAYIPGKKLVGLSKLVRIMEHYTRRLQIQERLTNQIADYLNRKLDPIGVMVVMEAEHLCMTMRGVKKPGSITVTSALRGAFKKNPQTRAEAMSLINKR